MDIRGNCQRTDCIYNNSGRCDMLDDIYMPEEVENCDIYEHAEN